LIEAVEALAKEALSKGGAEVRVALEQGGKEADARRSAAVPSAV
jgi:hypothetical protein